MKRLALGTAQFGSVYGVANETGKVEQAEATKMVHFALKNKIDTIDTAISYGDSESCLGQIEISACDVVTKLPPVSDDCSDVISWVKSEVKGSLTRIGPARSYSMLVHHSDQLLGPNGANLYKALEQIKEEGLVEKIGVSIYSPDELITLFHSYRLDMVQAPLNLFDRRLYTSGWLHKLWEEGIEVHTRSAFLQGLLLMEPDKVPAKFAVWSDLLRSWHNWLEGSETSAIEACLSFPLSFPEISRVVVGAYDVNQLAGIIKGSNARLTEVLPDVRTEDENLINPSNWHRL